MAKTNRSKFLQIEREADERFSADMLGLVNEITRLVFVMATTTNDDGQAAVPFRRAAIDRLNSRIWSEVLKPYFIGSGDEPLIEAEPQSPYMQAMVDGIRAHIGLVVERQVTIIRKQAAPDIADFLTGPRSIQASEMRASVKLSEQAPNAQRPWYDPFHRFVDADGYRLSDRGWRVSQETRNAINNLMTYEIGQGTSAVDIARKLEQFLYPEARAIQTRTPYGNSGSYWARRLSRTEITAASGRSNINAAILNPYQSGLKWNLSASHPCCDICDERAAGGPDGNGVYPPTDFPQYPAHPHEICYLTDELAASPAAISDSVRAWIEEPGGPTPEAIALQGAFNPDWLFSALLTGGIISAFFDNDFIDWKTIVQLA